MRSGKMRNMREQIKAVENLRKAAEQLERGGQTRKRELSYEQKNTVQDFYLPYGSTSFAENVAVRPGTCQCQHQNIIVNTVD